MAPLYLKELLHIHSRDSRLRQSGRLILRQPIARKGGGPRVVVSTAAFHARVRGSVPGLAV